MRSFSALPDLLLIDGGDKHAASALRDLGITVPVFGMVRTTATAQGR